MRSTWHRGVATSPAARRLIACALCALLGVALAAPSIGHAQQGTATAATPIASPASGCVVPASAPPPAFPAIDPPRVASPLPTAVASPGASPVATPVATIAIPADPATTAAIGAVVDAIAACQTAGFPPQFVDLVTPGFLSQLYGGGGFLTREAFLRLAPDLPAAPGYVQAIDDIRLTSPRSAQARIDFVTGNQVQSGVWSFAWSTAGQDATGDPDAEGIGSWQASDIAWAAPTVPDGASTLDLRMTDGAYAPATATIDGPDVAITVTNGGREDHEALVLRLDQGARPEDLLSQPGPGLPPGFAFAGQVAIPAGATGSLVLVGLQPGSYAVVDLLPDADGVPHLASGMAATITVS